MGRQTGYGVKFCDILQDSLLSLPLFLAVIKSHNFASIWRYEIHLESIKVSLS